MLLVAVIGLGFANSASAEVMSGSLGYQHNYISGKTKVFRGDLAVGSASIPLGAGFSVNHWFAYDPAEKKFFERDWSLVKSFSAADGKVSGSGFSVNHWFAYDPAEKKFFERDWSLVKSFSAADGKVSGSASANLYSFGSRYFDLADKGDAASLEANASVPVAEGISLFGGAESITIISADGDFTTAYAGVKLQKGELYLKPRFQVQTNDSPYLQLDVGGSFDAGNGITLNPSAKIVVAEDRQPMAQASVSVCF